MPCHWREALGDFAGCVRYRRHFSWVTPLAEQERVWLTFAGATESIIVHLNDHLICQQDEARRPCALEVTRLLQRRCELVVDVTSPTTDGGLWGEVALEVRCTAFLQNLKAIAINRGGQARLEVSGEIAGTHHRPLDLYLLASDATVTNISVEAGQPFVITGEAPPTPLADVPWRLELIDGATVWDAQPLEITQSCP
jgi:hypothetical protein